jgi:UDPglucose 6-dehydrogenase
VAGQLQLQGAIVWITDPRVLENCRRTWPRLDYAASAEEAADRADAVLLLTEWKQHCELNPVAFGKLVRQKRILDGRDARERVH